MDSAVQQVKEEKSVLTPEEEKKIREPEEEKKILEQEEGKKMIAPEDEVAIDVDIDDLEWKVETESPKPDVVIEEKIEIREEDPRDYGCRVINKHVFTWVYSFLFGIYGVDRFVRGQIGLGILKLMTFGGFGFWAIADVVVAASKSYGYAFSNDEELIFLDDGSYAR